MIRIPRNAAGRIAWQCARSTGQAIYANNGIYVGGKLIAACADAHLGAMIERTWMDYDKLPTDAPGSDDPDRGPQE